MTFQSWRDQNIIINPWQYAPPESIGFVIGKSKTTKTKVSDKRKAQNPSRKKNRAKHK